MEIHTHLSLIQEMQYFLMIINKKLSDKITDNINTSLITLKNIEIDTTKFDSLSFYVVDLPEIFTADGLLGYNILVNKKIIIDYTNHILYYSRC